MQTTIKWASVAKLMPMSKLFETVLENPYPNPADKSGLVLTKHVKKLIHASLTSMLNWENIDVVCVYV